MENNFDYNGFSSECWTKQRKLTKQEKHEKDDFNSLASYYPAYNDFQSMEIKLTIKESF